MLVLFPKGSEVCVSDLEDVNDGLKVLFTAATRASSRFTARHIVSLLQVIPCLAQKRNMANSSEIRGFLLRKIYLPPASAPKIARPGAGGKS